MATSVKEEARKIVDALPEDATWEDVSYQVYLRAKIEAGLRSAQEERTYTLAEIRAEFEVDESE